MVYKLFDKKVGSGATSTSKARVNVNEVLGQGLHKWVIKKFKRRKVNSRFKYNIGAVDLAEMGSLPSFNCSVKYFLFVIDVLTNYVWIKPLKGKKPKPVLDGFMV